MTDDEVLALLDLLESRGVVAWVTAPDRDTAEVALLVDTDGFESVATMLVSRGFAISEDALPTRLVLSHASHGAVELHPAAFDAELNATRFLAGEATTVIPGAALTVDTFGSGRARQVRG